MLAMALCLVTLLAPHPRTAEGFGLLVEQERIEAARDPARLEQANLQGALQAASSLREGPKREAALFAFAARLVVVADSDGPRAVGWLQRIPNLSPNSRPHEPAGARARAQEYVFKRWAEREPAAASRVALEQVGAGQPIQLGWTVKAWIEQDPRQASAWILDLEPRVRAQHYLDDVLFSALEAADPKAAIETAERLPRVADWTARDFTIKALAKVAHSDLAWAVKAFERFAERYPTERNLCLLSTAERIAGTSPERAVQFVRETEKADQLNYYVSLYAVAGTWARTDPGKATRLAHAAAKEKLEHGVRAKIQDARWKDTLGDIVVAWDERARAQVDAWLQDLTDPALRAHVNRRLLYARLPGGHAPRPQPAPTRGGR